MVSTHSFFTFLLTTQDLNNNNNKNPENPFVDIVM